MKYEDITLEECFVLYHTKNISVECDADMGKVIFRKEE